MAGKIMELALKIKGQLDSSTTAVMRSVSEKANELQNKFNNLSKATKTLSNAEDILKQTHQGLTSSLANQTVLQKTMDRFRNLKMASAETSSAFEQAKAKTAQLAAEFRQSQTATAQLKARLDQAKTTLQTMESSMPKSEVRALRAEIKALNQEYKTSAAATKAAEQAFNSSKQNAAGLKVTLEGQRGELQRIRSTLQAAKISTLDYANSYNTLKKRINETNAALEANNQKMQQSQKRQEAVKARDNAQQQLFAASGNFYMGLEAAKGIMSPFVGAIETAAEFQAAMSKVKAITGATSEEFSKLEAEAKRLGRTTPFTAKQSADAMTYLGMAGWNTEQILAGMPGLLNLASASGTDLARTADILSDDLTAFGLSAEHAAHMADVFTLTATRTNTNVEMIGETMKYAAPVARGYGATMEETAALTGLMANAGVKASQAGTSLRAGFLRLAGPPKKAAKALEEMGVSLSDATREQEEARATLQSLGIDMDSFSGSPAHKMVGIITELRNKTAGMASEQKLAALSAIFGTNAATGWLNVLEAGPEVFEELVTQMENCDGQAEKTAGIMQDNAQGAITKFKSAAEGAALAIGEKFLPYVAKIAEIGAGVAETIGKWAEEHEGIIITLGVAAGAIASFIVALTGLGFVVAGVNFAMSALAAFSLAETFAPLIALLPSLGAILGVIWALAPAIAAIAVIGAVLYANWDTVCEVATIVADKISVAWEQVKERLQPVFDKISSALDRLGDIFGGVGEGSSVVSSILNTMGALIVAVVEIALEHFAMLIEIIAIVFDTGVTMFGNLLDFIGNVFTGNIQGALDNLVNIFKAAFNMIFDIASTIIGSIADKISGVASAVSGFFGFGGGGGNDVSHNAQGGIYNKGAFLTTFAENSPEAAIPLDGSRRALSLWQQAGQILGVIPSMSAQSAGAAVPRPVSRPVAMEPPSHRQDIKMEFAPTININGSGNSSDVGSIVKAALREQYEQFMADLPRLVEDMQANKRRLSYE